MEPSQRRAGKLRKSLEVSKRPESVNAKFSFPINCGAKELTTPRCCRVEARACRLTVWPMPKKLRRLMPAEMRGLKPVTPAGPPKGGQPPPIPAHPAPLPALKEYLLASSPCNNQHLLPFFPPGY